MTSTGSGGYPLFREMAKDLIQKLMTLHTVEAATLRHKLVTLSATLHGWPIENPPPAADIPAGAGINRHATVNEMIEAILAAQELLQYPTE